MRRHKISTMTCAIAFSLAFGIAVFAQQKTDLGGFVQQAAIANMAEVQLGQLANQKSQNADVKRFAQMMVDDHTKGLNELKQAASGAPVQFPTQVDDKHKQLHQKLSGLSGPAFDREYMKAMVDGHREVEKLLLSRAGHNEAEGQHSGAARTSTERASAEKGAAVKTEASADAAAEKVNQWAAQKLPTTRAHLKQAEQINEKVQKS